MKISRGIVSLLVAAAVNAPRVFLDSFKPKQTRGSATKSMAGGSGRTKPRQTVAQNKRAAIKAKNVKRHRAACRA